MSGTRNRKPREQVEGIPRRPDGKKLLGPLESSVSSAASAAAAASTAAATALALAGAHAARHAAAGADPVSVLSLGGFPGGTASFLRADASFAAPVGAPAGSTTQVQFNDAGALAGDAGLVYDKVTDTLTLAGLLDLAGAAAGQIKFPASQHASADANTLDDYEEGTWLPAVGGSATYTTQTGTYTKTGRLVFVRGNMIINAIGSGDTGAMSGLPFAAATTTAAVIGFFAVSPTSINWISGVVSGASFVVTGTTAAGGSASIPLAVFGNGANVHFAACYEV